MAKRPHLHLIRGLPGSGKTTIALTKWVPLGYVHFENDMFYVKEGVYTYSPEDAKDARDWCQCETYKALLGGWNVVVCNTFITRWSARPYREMCLYDKLAWMTFEEATGNYGNTHGVPADKIEDMRDSLERWPVDWQWPAHIWDSLINHPQRSNDHDHHHQPPRDRDR